MIHFPSATLPDSAQEFFSARRSYCLLNPKLEETQKKWLTDLYQKFDPEISEKQKHVWIASSGSSQIEGESLKLIALSFSALISSAEAVNLHLNVNSSDKWIQVLPLFHVGGLGIEVRAYLKNISVIQGLQDQKWNAKYFLETIHSSGATLTALVPTQVYDLVALNANCPPTLRAVVVGGAALSEDLYLKARELGWPLLPSYGMTEVCSQVATASLSSLDQKKYPDSIEVLSHVSLDETSANHYQVQSPALMTGYAQIKNGSSFFYKQKSGFEIPDQLEVSKTPAGQVTLRFVGRSQDFVKIHGEGINLASLELRIKKHLAESFAETGQLLDPNGIAVIVKSDVRSGAELILAVEEKTVALVLHEALRLSLANFNKSVAPYERLSDLHKVLQFPRSPLGKILKDKILI